MCLTTLLLYKHGITSFTWTGIDFGNRIENSLKNVKEHGFSENRFLQGKSVDLRLFTVTLIYKNVLDGIHEL